MIKGHTVHFKNGTAVRDVDAVVYATGYRSAGSFDSFVEPPLRLDLDPSNYYRDNAFVPTESYAYDKYYFPGQLHLDVLFHANPRLFYMSHNEVQYS